VRPEVAFCFRHRNTAECAALARPRPRREGRAADLIFMDQAMAGPAPLLDSIARHLPAPALVDGPTASAHRPEAANTRRPSACRGCCGVKSASPPGAWMGTAPR